MGYSIKTVCALTGIPRATLHTWERRYEVVTPQRAPNGYREYSDGDVRLLLRIKRLVDAGRPIREAMEQALAGGAAGPDHASSGQHEPLRDALLAMDAAQADAHALRLGAYSDRSLLDEVYLPILREVGDRWHAGSASVAQEHFASAFLRARLVEMMERVGYGPAEGPVAMVAGYPGELHEFGLMGVAIRLATSGWRVVYLGADLPVDELIVTARTLRPQLIAQSVVTERAAADVLAHAQKVLAQVDEATRLVLGGPGVAVLRGQDSERLLIAQGVEELRRWLG